MLLIKTEYIAVAESIKEIFYIRDILEELYYNKSDIKPFRLLIDNKLVINLVNNLINYPKTKYIRVRYYFIKDVIS